MSTVRKSRLLAAGVGLLLGLGILGPDVVAQAPAVPRWAALEQTVGKEEYAEAKRLADAILQQGPPADRAMYFLAINAAYLGDKTLAESSCREFLRKYPQSGWAQDVQAVLDNEVSKLQDKRKGREQ
jgi:outer membrane protein assembly factor BamD (BamD/ComL family)